MPYLKDPRGRVTLNLQPDEHASLISDAAQAGYSSPGTYALALVRARGAALRPVVDENGAQRVSRLRGKLTVLTETLAACEAARRALDTQCRALQQELAQRPTWADQERMLNEMIAVALAKQPEAAPVPPTVEEQARQARLQARRAPKPLR